MRIAVTGGAGFIGSHVVDEYIKAGHEVIVIDNLKTGKRENLNPNAKFYLIDIRAEEVEKILKYEKVDIVNHHAAQISVPESTKDPVYDLSVNVEGTINLLKASVKAEVKKFIFISTGGAIYGEAEDYPFKEDTYPHPESPYAVSKLSAENYVKYFYYSYGLPYTILRYANVYGPRQIPQGEAGVISIFVEKMLRDEDVQIFTYPDDDYGMIRDYVYVKDVSKANVLALEQGHNDVFNISTMKETKTVELFEIIKKIIGSKSEYRLYPPRPGDLRKSCLVNKKAEKLLGWFPSYTLEEGVRETVEWYRKLYY